MYARKKELQKPPEHTSILRAPLFVFALGPPPILSAALFMTIVFSSKQIWTPQQCLLPSWKCGLVMCAGITSGLHLSLQNDLLLLEAVVLIQQVYLH